MLRRAAILAGLSGVTLFAQDSKLAAERKVYETYRAWVNRQPVAVQRSADVLQQYGAVLKGQGISDSDIASQLQLLQKSVRRLEVERWNESLTAAKPNFNTKPNAFLVEMASKRPQGAALDVGMGQGRNAIWLAQQGWTVTGFDPAERAVELARQTAKQAGVSLTAVVDASETFDFGQNRWDLILFSYVSLRTEVAKTVRALKPGGVIVVEAFHRDATKGRSIGGGVVWDSGELPLLFKDLRVVRYEEPAAIGDFGLQPVRIVRFCAEKPLATP